MTVQGTSYPDAAATQENVKLIWLRGKDGVFCVHMMVPTVSLF